MHTLPPVDPDFAQDATRLDRIRRQQALTVRFALFALRSRQIPDLLRESCVVVAEGLEVSFAKVLRHLPEENSFLLEAGIGWLPEDIGTARLGADLESPAGFAFQTGQPVLSVDLPGEKRFRTPELLRKYGIKRALNVIIRGDTQRYGVLEADAPASQHLSARDIAFLETIANTIALALERDSAETVHTDSPGSSTSMLDASPDSIQLIGIDGQLEFINRRGAELLKARATQPEAALGDPGSAWLSLWQAAEQGAAAKALAQAAAGTTSRFEAPWPTSNETEDEATSGTQAAGGSKPPMWFDVTISPVRDDAGEITRLMATWRDITERVANEQSLTELLNHHESRLDHQKLLLLEVHHRVRNSLQLIRTLLSMQAATSMDVTVREHLNAASNRVMTVGAVHERLYREGAPMDSDAVQYLQALLDDLQRSLADWRGGRNIVLNADPLPMPADRLTSLGLITAELVTNALKYGRGTVTVSLNSRPDALELTVEDDGPGFPESFPQPQSQTGGLGIRLVRTFSRRGDQAIHIDRTVQHSRIVVRLDPVASAAQ
ncbi:sensor histidine kinase [Pigmentiphaga aceris]|nr:histidine kinase dimerization/phosphoacceptor domain -containing protein [Pigmentiphaga aceris]